MPCATLFGYLYLVGRSIGECGTHRWALRGLNRRLRPGGSSRPLIGNWRFTSMQSRRTCSSYSITSFQPTTVMRMNYVGYFLQNVQTISTRLLLVLFSSKTWPWSRSSNQTTSNLSPFCPKSLKSVVSKVQLSEPSKYARIAFVSTTLSLPAKTTVTG